MCLGAVIHQTDALQARLSLRLPFLLSSWALWKAERLPFPCSPACDCFLLWIVFYGVVLNTSLLTQSHDYLFLCFLPSFIAPAFRFIPMIYFEFIFIQCASWVQVHFLHAVTQLFQHYLLEDFCLIRFPWPVSKIDCLLKWKKPNPVLDDVFALCLITLLVSFLWPYGNLP